jgi:hypothetical protein
MEITAGWLNELTEGLSRLIIEASSPSHQRSKTLMAQKPFLALVIPAAESTAVPPGHAPGGPPGQAPGGPPGQQRPGVAPPIYIDPPDVPDVPEGTKLVLVWDGENWQWAMLAAGGVTQPIAPTATPKR